MRGCLGNAIGPGRPDSRVAPVRERGADRSSSSPEPAAERFRKADSYRARREWQRYEGTGQRDLFRQLRERFLVRHLVEGGWVLDLGSGPGRFLPFEGGTRSRRVALDLSREMLNLVPEAWSAAGSPGPTPQRVMADALRPPFAPGRFAEVVVLGNTLGFAEKEAGRLLQVAEELVAPGGVLLIEVAPAAGERSKYLARLPAPSGARLLRAPVGAVRGRILREGFRIEPARRVHAGSFRRFSVEELQDRWRRSGWEMTEAMAVAPVLGPDADRIAAVRRDGKAWAHLLELEEYVGRLPERWANAAAVLLSARRPGALAIPTIK